jgi:hypothetical protein
MKFLQFAVNNVVRNKIPRLSLVQRPQGSVSIGVGRTKDDDASSGLSPDTIPAPRSTDADVGEMMTDISSLLRRKEGAEGLPLVQMFLGMMRGEKTDQQRSEYGDRPARRGREIIFATIEDYARSTGNTFLLQQMQMLAGRNPRQALPPRRTLTKPTQPKLEPGKDKDYQSIVSVIARLGRPAGTADLGKHRRRWLEYPPRNPASTYRNRLEEVLDGMVRDGVLKAIRTAKGALTYEQGPRFNNYLPANAPTPTGVGSP